MILANEEVYWILHGPLQDQRDGPVQAVDIGSIATCECESSSPGGSWHDTQGPQAKQRGSQVVQPIPSPL